jgi:uncharacterized repeat protein (TIGR01451 family)
MSRIARVMRGILTVSLGVGALVLTVMSVQAETMTEIDLAVTLHAPDHVAADAIYTVNVAYENIGTVPASEARVTATLPLETQFISATDRWGAALPPVEIDGNVLVWDVGPVPIGSCCDHILIALQTNAGLANETPLTTTVEIATTAIESDTTNNTAQAVSVICDMAGSTKQVHAGEIMPGDVLTYTLQLQYQHRAGDPNQRWVELTDTLPFSHQVRFLGWVGSITGTQHTSQALQWQGQVRAGEPFSLQYRLGVETDVPPGTVITNGAVLRWSNGEMQLGPVTTVVTMPHYAYMFGPNGGEWAHQYGVTLTVPPHAVTETTRFQFREMSQTEIISGPPGLMWAHRAFELTAYRFGEVHQFGQPITITIHYSDTDVIGLKRETLRLWSRNGEGEPWAMLGEPVCTPSASPAQCAGYDVSGTLSFTTTHFTEFALFAEGAYRVYLPQLAR